MWCSDRGRKNQSTGVIIEELHAISQQLRCKNGRKGNVDHLGVEIGGGRRSVGRR
jgi:hypothetical protein